jgi:hypothetical protein
VETAGRRRDIRQGAQDGRGHDAVVPLAAVDSSVTAPPEAVIDANVRGHPLWPTQGYGLSKQLDELIAQSLESRGRMEVICLRPSWVLFPDAVTRQVPREDPRPRRAMSENQFSVICAHARCSVLVSHADWRSGFLVFETRRSSPTPATPTPRRSAGSADTSSAPPRGGAGRTGTSTTGSRVPYHSAGDPWRRAPIPSERVGHVKPEPRGGERAPPLGALRTDHRDRTGFHLAPSRGLLSGVVGNTSLEAPTSLPVTLVLRAIGRLTRGGRRGSIPPTCKGTPQVGRAGLAGARAPRAAQA